MDMVIYNSLIGENIDDAKEILSAFGNVEFVDEKIDDGCDDYNVEGDTYIMMRSYDVGEHYVRIYYGDNSGIIGDVDVN